MINTRSVCYNLNPNSCKLISFLTLLFLLNKIDRSSVLICRSALLTASVVFPAFNFMFKERHPRDERMKIMPFYMQATKLVAL